MLKTTRPTTRRWIAPLLAAALGANAGAADLALTQYVNPFVGTAVAVNARSAGANTTPAAMVPFGMVQFGPDNTADAGGYRYNQPKINAFSMTRFSGRAVACWLDLGLMPTTGFTAASTSPGADWLAYAQTFGHGSPAEAAKPGFYHVHLNDKNIDADLTATARTAFGRFTFPANSAANLLINAAHSSSGNIAAGTRIASIDPVARTVTGFAQSGGCGADYKVYFVLQFDRSWSGQGTWTGATNTANASQSGAAAQAGAWLDFGTATNRTVQVKVGLSFVSIANASDNLARENPNSFVSPNDFDSVKARADAAWNTRLNQIQVTGNSVDQKTAFYTALYHTHIHPSIFSDGNGQYTGIDGATRTLATGRVQYHNFAMWDQHRTLMPLLAIVAPDEASDMMESLANHVKSRPSGTVACIPSWQQGNSDSRGVLGDTGSIAVANMYAYGITDFDTATLKQAMLDGANNTAAVSDGKACRPGLADYLSTGYVAVETSLFSGSLTLEYAAADFGISRFASMLGDNATAATYQARAQNWKKLWNPVQPSISPHTYTGYLMPRKRDGSFVAKTVIEDAGYGVNKEDWFESNAAQYLWMVPYNRAALIALLGGNATASQRLSDHFGTTKADLISSYTNFTAYLGNEPSELHPAVYAYTGKPAKGAEVWRRLFQSWYVDPLATNASIAAIGNDDGGALSSMQVFSALGLNHAVDGVAGFIVGSPVFDKAVVRLKGGNTLTINAALNSTSSIYVQYMNLNGAAYSSAWLPWASVKNGGVIDVGMGTGTNSTWGTDLSVNPPPSFDATTPLPLRREAEALPVSASTTGVTVRVATDGLESGGSGLITESSAVGQFVSLTVNVPEARTYRIKVGLKNSNNRGAWQFSSNGYDHGAIVDQYSATASYPVADLGSVAFAAGDKTFRFQLTGINAASQGGWIALDYIELVPQ